MSVLVDRFLNDALFDLRKEFAFACADRAVRRYAVDALRAAGFEEMAGCLQRAPVTDGDTARRSGRLAADTSRFVDDTDSSARTRLAADATRSASEASLNALHACTYVDSASPNPTYAYAYINAVAINTVAAASNAAAVSHNTARAIDRAAATERKAQDEWIRAHWAGASPITAATLAAVDAYIADGLLLGDDE